MLSLSIMLPLIADSIVLLAKRLPHYSSTCWRNALIKPLRTLAGVHQTFGFYMAADITRHPRGSCLPVLAITQTADEGWFLKNGVVSFGLPSKNWKQIFTTSVVCFVKPQ